MKFYTGTGDKGETSVMGGRTDKDDPRMEAIGSIDELNSAIGLAIAFQKDKKVIDILENVQNKLFTVGAELATQSEKMNTPKITEGHVKDLEKTIDGFELGEIKKFILPNGTPSSNFLHFARTVARRAERVTVSFAKKEKVNEFLLKYLNRLSSLLFVLAVYVNRKENGKETNPTYL